MALVTLTARVEEDNVGYDPFFSDENMVYVKKSVQELREGRGTIHQLIETDNE